MCLRPGHIPKARLKGAKAAGVRYEKRVAAAIPAAEPGQWFEFCDANGPGHCQTDLLIVGKKHVVVLECKLSNVELGRAQLAELYLPVVQRVWPERKVLGIVVARHLSQEPDLWRVVETLDEAICKASAEKIIPTLHWLERGPI